MIKKSLVTLLLMLLASQGIYSSTVYNSRHNRFASLKLNSKAIINGDYLQIDNSTSSNIFITDTTSIDPFEDYKFYIHFANKHNNEGKSYKVTDKQGKKKMVTETMGGIVFNIIAPSSYWMVTARCSNSNLYNECVDNRTMTIELTKVTDGKKALIEKVTLDKGMDLYDGFNYLGVQIESNVIKVIGGEKQLTEILTHQMTKEELELTKGHSEMRVGCVATPGAYISIERTVLSYNNKPDVSPNLETAWTKEALDRHFAESKNPYEGYWTYLDRDMEDTWLKMGGRYTIALVETSTGYDVIYIDGAQVKKSQWHLGMKKGEMTKTIFTDNFTGSWYDATQEVINEDVYATFESGVILCFKFPVYKSQLRFSKILN